MLSHELREQLEAKTNHAKQVYQLKFNEDYVSRKLALFGMFFDVKNIVRGIITFVHLSE